MFVKVIFNQFSKGYHYKTNLNLEVGDLVIVKTPSEYKVVEVFQIGCEVDEENSDIEYKWIVQKLDLTNYHQLTGE